MLHSKETLRRHILIQQMIKKHAFCKVSVISKEMHFDTLLMRQIIKILVTNSHKHTHSTIQDI